MQRCSVHDTLATKISTMEMRMRRVDTSNGELIAEVRAMAQDVRELRMAFTRNTNRLVEAVMARPKRGKIQ